MQEEVEGCCLVYCENSIFNLFEQMREQNAAVGGNAEGNRMELENG